MSSTEHENQNPHTDSRRILKVLIALLVLLFIFTAIESWYRVFNPYPYVSNEEINHTDHGNLSEYDPYLGWKGVPWGKEQFATKNRKVLIQHNRFGFRDIDHDMTSEKPAIVVLGDSFGWGYEVEFDEMLVNILREKLRKYEVFNLSHRGYGNDQELLTFEKWEYKGPLATVLLLFTDDDVYNNNTDIEYDKAKPKFEIAGDELVLTGVPVPEGKEWVANIKKPTISNWRKTKNSIKKFLFKSQFLHAMYSRWLYFRLKYFNPEEFQQSYGDVNPKYDKHEFSDDELTLTSMILAQLKKETEDRGGKLIIVFVPYYTEVFDPSVSITYQDKIKPICKNIGIVCFDLAPYFKNTWRRTYYRADGHWNQYGHRIAADAIYNILVNDLELNIETDVKGNLNSKPSR